MKDELQSRFEKWNREHTFSGVFSARNADGVLFERACGYRNRAEQLPNRIDTAFAIASGTKLFTELAASKLMDEGKLSFDDRVWDLLPYDLKNIDKRVTAGHLITHTSGIGDYIDEESSSDYDDTLALYDRYPVHQWDHLSYYLPMYNELPAKFEPGARYGYSNAGFALLGLVIEQASGMEYHEYIREAIIKPLALQHTGHYRIDRLPGNTALGYIRDAEGDGWHTNFLCMPAIGGADGGIYTCASDLYRLWTGILRGELFSKAMVERFFTPHAQISKNGEYSGLGVYLYKQGAKSAYYAVGSDFGVDFFTLYAPKTGIVVSALGNTEMNTWSLLMQMRELLA